MIALGSPESTNGLSPRLRRVLHRAEHLEPLPGMPHGKPAGVRCVNLDDDHLCKVWNTPQYPPVCRGFRAEPLACGSTREEAIVLLTIMERETS